MPTLLIFGLPYSLQGSPHLLQLCEGTLPHRLADVPALGITPEVVCVYPISDMLGLDYPNVTVLVPDFFDRPERSLKVREEVRRTIRECVNKVLKAHGYKCEDFPVALGWQREE